jgi:glycerophosphoryl diester phosphodiesterase
MPQRQPPVIVAHRGIHHGLPENSREAIWKALADAFWVELDVHAAADGVPVVIHDDTLDRTTMATGPVWALSSAELKKTGLRGGGLVPTLEDCLAHKRDPQLGWVVEIKPPGAYELVRRTYDLLCGGYFMIQSFDPDNVRYGEKLWECPTALLVGDQQELDAALASGTWEQINVHHRLLTPALVERLRAQRAGVGAWTVNEEPDIRRVIDLGVDLIISDNPWRVREAVYYLSPDEWRAREGR